jgi:hypothetical protein
VVIEMAASERAVPLSTALVDACSRAVSGGACALSTGSPDQDSPAVAIVTWHDGRTKVRIEVGLRRADHAEWLSRSLEFKPEDSEIERFRSAGLVVATLVGDVRAGVRADPEPPHTGEADAAGPAPPPPAPAPPPKETPPANSPAHAERVSVALDGALLVGSALDRGAPRLGPAIRGSVRVFGLLTLTASVSYALRPVDAAGIDVRWITAGGGLGVTARPARSFVVRTYAEGLFEVVTVAGAAARADHRSQTLPVARLTGDVAWMPSEHVGPAFALQATAHAPRYIEVNERLIEREGPVGVTGLIGVRVVP